jgi:uncharacterized damage-inducible protein DinB
MMTDAARPEPWLRGTLTQFPAVHRAVLHALQHTKEDLERWCGDLNEAEINARPSEVASVAFHLRHIARSVDRLLTYAEGRPLNEAQLVALKTELAPDAVPAEVFKELRDALEQAATRVCTFSADQLETPRAVGRQSLPTTIGGLLVHVAEHTQRHVGQAITTAKIVRAARPA